MSFGQVVIGLASLALGIQQLRNGTRTLGEAAKYKPDVARKQISSHGQMRVYKVRSLEDRIKHLRGRVAKGKVDPEVYSFTRAALTQRCGSGWCVNEKDTLREAEAIFKAVRNNVRYTSDIAGIDTYQSPSKTLKLKAGDCDDYSSLICSALLSAGIPCRFKVIRTKDSNEWNHIYAQAGLPRNRPSRWVSMDASVPVRFGWEAPKSMVAESKIFSVG